MGAAQPAPFCFQQVNMQTHPPIQRAVRFSELSQPRQMLVRLCQAVDYGSLRQLEIKNREPLFEPPPVLAIDMKLDGTRAVRAELELHYFVLRDELRCLMDHFDRLVTTTIEHLEVHAGIPKRVILILSPEGRTTLLALKPKRP